MRKRENTLLLLFGPAGTVVGTDMLSRDVFSGAIIVLLAAFIAVMGSYYQWVTPKNRSKLWLVFPAFFTVFGYIPLMLLGEKKRIYSHLFMGNKFYKSPDARDNFTLVAANVTKYYLELIRNYRDRFNSPAALIATAGILDAQVYLCGDQNVSSTQILDLAKKAVLHKEQALVDFIVNLEIRLFQIDAPEYSIDEMKEACFEKRANIEYVVRKVAKEYAGEAEYASATSDFMSSSQFEAIRLALGINALKHTASTPRAAMAVDGQEKGPT